MTRGITLRQGTSVVHLKAIGAHEILSVTERPGLPRFEETSYDGLVRIGSGPTSAQGDTTHRQVYPTNYERFRLEIGESYTYDTIYRTGGWLFGIESTDTTNLTVVGRDLVRIGACAYPTLVIEKIVAAGMRGLMSDRVPEPRLFRMQYSPDLRVVLVAHRATEPPITPDSLTAD